MEDTSDDSLPMGFPEVGTWNSTHNVSLNDMNLDARMVRIRFRMRNLILMMRAYICVYNLINTTAMPVNQPTTGFISTFIGSMVKGAAESLSISGIWSLTHTYSASLSLRRPGEDKTTGF